jgi:hypothetical protein
VSRMQYDHFQSKAFYQLSHGIVVTGNGFKNHNGKIFGREPHIR